MEERDRNFLENQERAKKELSSSFARTNASADQLEKEIFDKIKWVAKKQVQERQIEIEKREKSI